jgi:hypothetical protein
MRRVGAAFLGPHLGLIALCTLFCVNPSAVLADDYDDDPKLWNGIGYFGLTAREAKVELRAVEKLDWSSVGPETNLLVLYPRNALPVADLLRFVDDGGDLIVADDYGASKPLLSALGVKRVRPELERHRKFFQDEPDFPIVSAKGEHFLFYNIDFVITNHPAAFRGNARPVMTFDSGDEHLVVERRLGKGRILLIADSSLFLNDMLRGSYENKQFAANVLRNFCDMEPCQVSMVGPRGSYEGTYLRKSGKLGQLTLLFNEAGQYVNDVIASFASLVEGWPGRDIFMWVLFFLGLGAIALALGAGRLAPSIPSLGAPLASVSALELQARGLSHSRGDADFAQLARALVTEVDHALESDGRMTGRREARPAIGESPAVKNALLRIEIERASLLGPVPPVLSAERFVRIYDDARAVLTHVRNKRQG